MKSDLPTRIEALLADERHRSNPLRQPLAELLDLQRKQQRRADRLAQISDRFEGAAREANNSLTERFSRQLRQLERIARVSDRYQKMLRELNEALHEASTHDLLTGLPNRRHLTDRLKSEAARRTRKSGNFSLVMADIDHFKSVNDRFGHEGGDLVLVRVAGLMRATLREGDICGRWGGEEFLMLLPDTALDAAVNVIERVREAIASQPAISDGKLVQVTTSFGVAQWGADESYADALRRADEALYAAKRGGRDRVERAG